MSKTCITWTQKREQASSQGRKQTEQRADWGKKITAVLFVLTAFNFFELIYHLPYITGSGLFLSNPI